MNIFKWSSKEYYTLGLLGQFRQSEKEEEEEKKEKVGNSTRTIPIKMILSNGREFVRRTGIEKMVKVRRVKKHESSAKSKTF